jgi:uncharacterized protein YukE
VQRLRRISTLIGVGILPLSSYAAGLMSLRPMQVGLLPQTAPQPEYAQLQPTLVVVVNGERTWLAENPQVKTTLFLSEIKSGAPNALTGKFLDLAGASIDGVSSASDQDKAKSKQAVAALSNETKPSATPTSSDDEYKKFSENMKTLGDGLANLAKQISDPITKRIVNDLANAANFASSLAAASANWYAIPGALASGIGFANGLFGGGNSRDDASKAILQAIQNLSKQIEKDHREEMDALGGIAKQIADFTRTWKNEQLRAYQSCAELFQHSDARAESARRSPPYLSHQIPMVWTGPDLEVGRDTGLALTRKQCYAQLAADFSTGKTPPLFNLSTADAGPEGISGSDILDKLLLATQGVVAMALSDGSLGRFREPARTVFDLNEKLSVVDAAPAAKQARSLLLTSESMLDPWVTTRASGYALALYWTFEIYDGDGKRLPQTRWGGGGNGEQGRMILDAATKILNEAAAQERLLGGDVALPVIAALYKRDFQALKKLNIEGVLNKNVPTSVSPADASPDDQKRFEEIRNAALCAIGSNPWLAQNVLIYDLAVNSDPHENLTNIALGLASKGAVDLLPNSWRRDWAIQWEQDSANPAGRWVVPMQVLVTTGLDNSTGKPKSKCPGQPQLIFVPLPEAKDMVSGRFQQPLMLAYLEAEQSAAASENLAVAIGDGKVKGIDTAILQRVIRAGVDPTALAVQ